MPNYTDGGIFLNQEETAIFLDRLANPSAVVSERRDRFLAEIDRTLTVTQTDDGVCIDFSPDNCTYDTMTIIGIYNVRKLSAPVYRHYTMESSTSIKFEQRKSDGKREISYKRDTQNEMMHFELPLSA